MTMLPKNQDLGCWPAEHSAFDLLSAAAVT